MLTIRQTAKRLNVSISLVYRLIASGDLPCYEIATCKRVSEEDLQKYLETNRKTSTRLPGSSNRHF